MALNPAFASSSTRKLPFACGYVLGQGDLFLTTVAQDGSSYNLYLLGEGEWDGPEMVNTYANSTAGLQSQMLPLTASQTQNLTSIQAEVPTILHFHGGAYSVKGIGENAVSIGPDQGYDEWFLNFPTVTPPQCFSGIAYALWSEPAPSGFHTGTYIASTVSGMAIWRSTRCRIFDAYGNVVSYGFTCNPVWHRMEAILRFKLKVQQPPLAGLSAAEKAMFNWESIAECAARNDYILPNGNPRFVGNYIFAADATLANILETMMRADRSFLREQYGQIYMIGDDSRTSIFTLGLNHLAPGSSVKLTKKDISTAPNVFIPQYRDLDVPAVSEVAQVTFANTASGDEVTKIQATFTLTTDSPFMTWSLFVYGGSSNAAVDGDYEASAAGNGATQMSNFGPVTGASTAPPATGTGGYLGSHNARFSQRAPAVVRHLSAQKLAAQIAPGVAAPPRIRPVIYDCGNSTYDQANRLMKFERDRTLGTDTGTSWLPPVTGTITALLESVDPATYKALIDCAVHDVITLDSWVYPEAPGDYEILEMDIVAPSGDSTGEITLQLHQYNPNAATDVSDPPGDAYTIVPGTTFQLTGFTPVTNPAWTLQATRVWTAATDGTITVTIPDLLMQIGGLAGLTAYPYFSVSEVPSGTQVALYVQDATGTGTSPTYGFVSAASGSVTLSANQYLVGYYTFTGSGSSGTPGSTSSATYVGSGSGSDSGSGSGSGSGGHGGPVNDPGAD